MPTERDASGQPRWKYVPADCVNLLPFKSESLNQWRLNDDLSRFRQRLSLDQIDAFETGDAPDEAPPDILQLADDLSAGSEETYHEPKKETPTRIDYRDDLILGGFAKAWIAWGAVETELLSENGSFSLAHTLEATSDIDCALQLVKLRGSQKLLRVEC